MRGEFQRAGSLDWRPSAVDRYRVATLLLAAVAAVVAVLVATRVFPYYSINHDEGVYLQQAEMLLAGDLFLRPPVEDAFRPGSSSTTATGSIRSTRPSRRPSSRSESYWAGSRWRWPASPRQSSDSRPPSVAKRFRRPDGAAGRNTGARFAALPRPVGVYLPYALTTALNLAFALAYLRAERRNSHRAATVAGAAVGLAFFARPYTAVLFAAPFVAHACWTLLRSGAWRVAFGGDGDAALLGRRLATASLGTAGVVVALAYNWVVTGDPLVFPYQAFAPHDGIGFGHRAILGHEVDYTLELASRANGQVLRRLFTDWVVAGPLGTALAAVGVRALVRDRNAPTAPAVRSSPGSSSRFRSATSPSGELQRPR